MINEGKSRGGRRPGAGRRKTPGRLVNEAIHGIEQDLPALFRELRSKALAGDREALIYLIDRVLGKPKISAEIEGGEKIGAGIVLEIARIVSEKRKELEGQYAIQGQGITEGSSEEGSSEA